ncbi:MAG: TetR/AcrR family transcriptional regulator [Henriciella sp.]|nr:TetR/AcrR family transcriptional regulator [Henriciella sp.]
MNSISETHSERRKRLSKAERRRQLLDVAKHLLETIGADELTLAVLAERAGVSKPIAYDHFESRSGLLIALLDDTSQYYASDAEAKITRAPQTIQAIADIVATAYVQCSLDAGPALLMLAAAVEANSEARDAGRAVQRDHAASFQRAFETVLDDQGEQRAPLYKALVAAANSICDDRHQNKISTEQAVEALTHLLVTSLSPFAKTAYKSET